MKRILCILLGISLVLFLAAGCAPKVAAPTTEATTTEATTTAAETTAAAEETIVIERWGTVTLEDFTTKSPDGVKATSADVLKLTEEEKETIRSKNLKVAWLYGERSEWSRGLGNGSAVAMKDLNMELIFEDDAKWDPAKQVTGLENALVAKPDIILSLIIDPVGEAAAYRKAVDKGVILSFVDEIPQGFVHPDDYAGIVTADTVELGRICAELMAEAIGGKGKIGFLYLDAIFYNTNIRETACKLTLESKYPDIEIFYKGIASPDDAEKATAALITQNPDIKGFIAPWDTPAVSVVAACKAANRPDIKVVTYDLGAAIAVDMLKGGNTYGIAVESTAELGSTLIMMAAYRALGKEVPYFLIVPAYPVTAKNVLELWEPTIGAPAPPEVAEFAK